MLASRQIEAMSDVEQLSQARRSAAWYAVTAAAIAAVALLYYVTGKFGLRMALVHVSATAVWPPAGIAFAAMLLLGYRVWPGVFLGAFWVNITTAGTVATALGIATGNTLEAVVAAHMVCRFANGRRAFERSQDIIKLWVLGRLLSGGVAATFGATSLCVTGFADWVNYGSIFRTWWLGDATGSFLVGSVLILWATQPRLRWRTGRVTEALLLATVLCAVALMVFLGYFGQEYLALPLLLWAAFRFGTRETATAALVLAGIAIWATQRSLGPFANGNTNESLLELQVFMMVSAATTLVVAALVAERKRSARALAHAHDRLEQRVAQRTQELSHVNYTLRVEIEERARAEAQLADAS
ncbi:MAG TPA: MASE1 domain-containing protein, partial [Candidatus Krumholzibacteria bacterium]|nr:MASE1 domain-containing protein [Candidatus Krumholzibacteria bacterium]